MCAKKSKRESNKAQFDDSTISQLELVCCVHILFLSMSFSVLQVFPDSVSLWPLVSGQRQHLDALQDHSNPAEPQSLQQHSGLHRPDVHRRSQPVFQHPGHQAHNPAQRHHLRPNELKPNKDWKRSAGEEAKAQRDS